jgi:hypothetical protein
LPGSTRSDRVARTRIRRQNERRIARGLESLEVRPKSHQSRFPKEPDGGSP